MQIQICVTLSEAKSLIQEQKLRFFAALRLRMTCPSEYVRYPGVIIKANTAEEALSAAKRVRKFVRKKLKIK